jgi:RNA polymerase sigma factor (sigma-70 family)
MSMPELKSAALVSRNAQFVTTHWSVVLAAGETWNPNADRALEDLCRTYWYPLYAFLRRRGCGADDAQDLTQAFLLNLLERKSLRLVAPAKGKFRSFLLAALEHFLSNERARAHRLKRGGGQELLSLDLASAETRYTGEPADPSTPEKVYERHWALALLKQTLDHLCRDYESAGKGELFEHLQGSLTGDKTLLPYVELAPRLGMTEGAIKVAVHRLRQRYRELLREEIAQTVASPAEIDDEIRYLFTALGE